MVLKIQGSLQFRRWIESGEFLPLHPNLPSECLKSAKCWGMVGARPDPEMVLHPSLFATPCCQAKQIGCNAKSHRYQNSQLLDALEKYTQEAETWPWLDIPWAVRICSVLSFKLCHVNSILVLPFFPQKASRFVPAIGHVLLCFQAAERLLFVFFYTKTILTVNRKLRLQVTYF